MLTNWAMYVSQSKYINLFLILERLKNKYPPKKFLPITRKKVCPARTNWKKSQTLEYLRLEARHIDTLQCPEWWQTKLCYSQYHILAHTAMHLFVPCELPSWQESSANWASQKNTQGPMCWQHCWPSATLLTHLLRSAKGVCGSMCQAA